MILLRTTEVEPMVLDLADRLEAASGLPSVLLVDERRGGSAPCRRGKLSLDQARYAALDLHIPHDVGWRCGDYGFYVARKEYPEVERFWMFEFDVRLTGDARRFFELVNSRTELDLVVARLRPAGVEWWWTSHAASSDARPWRCFFPVVRLSARAIDQLYEKRRKHSRSPSRIALWPNDEVFVATTVANSDLRRADLNDLGERFYDDATFSYDNPVDGDGIAHGGGPPKLLHPVLTGEAYARKLKHMADTFRPDPPSFRVRRAVVRRINNLRRW